MFKYSIPEFTVDEGTANKNKLKIYQIHKFEYFVDVATYSF